MSENQVFINYIQEDQNIVEKICRLLSEQNIPYTLMPFEEDIETLLEMAKQIEDTIQNKGAMIAIISQNSIKNFRFISNVQYGCEKAVRRTVLAVYEIDKTMDNPLELYYGQAAVINAVNKADDFLEKLIENIKIILGRKDIPEEIRPKGRAQRIVKKISIGMFILAISIGISWIVVPMITGANLVVPEVIATPVVFENPYSGDSLDQGIVIDRRYVPEVQDNTDPVSQAPFHFLPSEVYRDFTFDDPSLDNVLDHSVVNHYAMKIMDEDKLIIQQDNGVLRYSIAPQDSPYHGDYWFPYSHLFNSEELEYMGIRFRIDDYQGWTDANQVITATFSLFGLDYYNELVDISISQQFLQSPFSSTNNIGSAWHTLEFLPLENGEQLDIYLDGELIGQSQALPEKPTYLNLVLSLVVDSSTDWVNFLVDEVVWGGETPEKLAENPEEAEYHFMPDEIVYQYTMDHLPPEDILQDRSNISSLKNGVLSFEIPAANNDQDVIFEIPGLPITEMNYFSMRFRLVDYQEEYWSTWGQIGIEYLDDDIGEQKAPVPAVSISRYTASHFMQFGQYQQEGISGSLEDLQYNFWHTMEMAIKPTSPGSDTYILAYWFDNVLVAEHPINKENVFSETEKRTFLWYHFQDGESCSVPFSGEIDEITAGYVNYFGDEK